MSKPTPDVSTSLSSIGLIFATPTATAAEPTAQFTAQQQTASEGDWVKVLPSEYVEYNGGGITDDSLYATGIHIKKKNQHFVTLDMNNRSTYIDISSSRTQRKGFVSNVLKIHATLGFYFLFDDFDMGTGIYDQDGVILDNIDIAYSYEDHTIELSGDGEGNDRQRVIAPQLLFKQTNSGSEPNRPGYVAMDALVMDFGDNPCVRIRIWTFLPDQEVSHENSVSYNRDSTLGLAFSHKAGIEMETSYDITFTASGSDLFDIAGVLGSESISKSGVKGSDLQKSAPLKAGLKAAGKVNWAALALEIIENTSVTVGIKGKYAAEFAVSLDHTLTIQSGYSYETSIQEDYTVENLLGHQTFFLYLENIPHNEYFSCTFATGDDTITQDQKDAITTAWNATDTDFKNAVRNGYAISTLTGYASNLDYANDPSDSKNEALARRRAEALRDFLIPLINSSGSSNIVGLSADNVDIKYQHSGGPDDNRITTRCAQMQFSVVMI